jgi:hypothetical protein
VRADTPRLAPIAGWVRTGMIVQVKGPAEIWSLAAMEAASPCLPFMTEMRRFCGGRFRVLHCANRLMVEGVGVRGIEDVVILDGVRCDGSAHGGCQRRCHLLWKEEWLEPAGDSAVSSLPREAPSTAPPGDIPSPFPACQGQAAVLMAITSPLSNFAPRQYLRDLRRREHSPGGILRIFATMLGTRLRWRLLALTRRVRGHPAVAVAPAPPLAAGDLVEIRSPREILGTLDPAGKLHGLLFAELMWRYCGKRFRVLQRVERMVVEETGECRAISHAVILEGVTCDGVAFRGCPRACYWMWKDAWLISIPEVPDDQLHHHAFQSG